MYIKFFIINIMKIEIYYKWLGYDILLRVVQSFYVQRRGTLLHCISLSTMRTGLLNVFSGNKLDTRTKVSFFFIKNL
jgi:hypothetical protein